MTGREALKALADGKRVRDRYADNRLFTLFDVLHDGPFPELGSVDDRFVVVEQPATDEELIAEMESIACLSPVDTTAYTRVMHCARMLRERKVKP